MLCTRTSSASARGKERAGRMEVIEPAQPTALRIHESFLWTRACSPSEVTRKITKHRIMCAVCRIEFPFSTLVLRLLLADSGVQEEKLWHSP